MQEKTNVLFVSDSLSLYSGFSYVISKLMLAFHETNNYNISYINLLSGDNEIDTVCKIHGEVFREMLCTDNKIRLYNCQLQSEVNIKNFDSIIEKEKPQLIISLIDPWQTEPIAYSTYRDTFYWVAYNTLELPTYPELVMFPTYINKNLRKSISILMNKADLVIPVTQMGKENFENINIKCTEPILCGVDYDKRCLTKETKQSVFGGHVPEDSFVFMTLGTNTERKKIDLTIDAFDIFLKKVENPEKYFLYIHTNPNEVSGGTDLVAQAVSLGILNKLLFPSSYATGVIMSQENLFKRTTVMDCYIGLPSGEGFGYGFADAMMHGLPLIYINYGGHVEYCKDAGLFVKVKAFYNSKNAYMKWAIADVEDASDQMLLMTQDKKLREKLSSIGKDTMKNYSWKIQSKKFIDLVMSEYNKVKDLKNDLHKNFYLKRII